MARFQGSVTQEGWSVEFEIEGIDTQEEGRAALTVQALAHTFIQAQTGLQAEAQRVTRETLQSLTQVQGYEANGQPQPPSDAETLTDSQVPHASS